MYVCIYVCMHVDAFMYLVYTRILSAQFIKRYEYSTVYDDIPCLDMQR